MHRNRGVLPSFIAGTTAQKSRSTAAINALYGLHLMHINRGTDCTVFEVNLQHINRGKVQHVFQDRSIYFRHEFQGRTAAFKAGCTVRS